MATDGFRMEAIFSLQVFFSAVRMMQQDILKIYDGNVFIVIKSEMVNKKLLKKQLHSFCVLEMDTYFCVVNVTFSQILEILQNIFL